ncbi:hypothetical protein AFLA_011386 [Aspergillus flavus NRRL3357]|nr:hypothetical protein AFLA_011386 [Aspergillus flavus NRRL3357]
MADPSKSYLPVHLRRMGQRDEPVSYVYVLSATELSIQLQCTIISLVWNPEGQPRLSQIVQTYVRPAP